MVLVNDKANRGVPPLQGAEPFSEILRVGLDADPIDSLKQLWAIGFRRLPRIAKKHSVGQIAERISR